MSVLSDPQRLAAGGGGSQLAELMSAASRDLPSDSQLSALAGRFEAVLDAPLPAAQTPPQRLSKLLKASLAVGAAGLLAGGAALLLRANDSVPQRPPPAPSALAHSTGSAAQPAPVVQPDAASDSTEQHVAPPSTGSAPVRRAAPADTISESALLEQARHSLSSAPAVALALTAKHAARFPRGILAQEREVIAIEALRRLHRTAEAERRAAAFAKAFPGSAHQRKLDEKP